MKKCPVSKLPVQEKPEWISPHSEDGYNTIFKCIGHDIVLMSHQANRDITLAGIKINRFQDVLTDLELTDKPLYIIADFENVRAIAYRYKKDMLNFIYNWGRNIRLAVLYNIHPDIAIEMETFQSLSSEKTRLLCAENYREAIETVLSFKSGKPFPSSQENSKDKSYELLKNEFLAVTARMSLLQMTNQQINIPPAENILHPFFRAIKSLQSDLHALNKEHQLQMEQLKTEYDEQLSKTNIRLNAEIELNRQTICNLDQEKSSLKGKIAVQEIELNRISAAVNKNSTVAEKLCSTIHILDIDPEVKQKMLTYCRALMAAETVETRYINPPIDVNDSEFLLQLQKKYPGLNHRELRLALLVKMNYNNTQIARTLGISKRGAESIRYRMHKKLGIKKHQSIKNCLLEITAP
ncbi:MAG: transcriptional regulator [Chlorobiaceae bacterium]|nr:transcriptional regulator [Chlorobiaceae bacterium]